MALGICTVYLVDPADEPLLDLHLRQIEDCTTVPFTIYAAVNRLAPRLVQKLQRRAAIRICPCPPTDLRGKEEHAFYLEHLVRAAVQDGATHLVTLHGDSFPIRRGWAEDLMRRLAPSCAVVTANRVNTACLLFPRDFYVRHQPRFLLTDADRASPRFGEFLAQWNPVDHSGTGYAFRAFLEGLSVRYLKESPPDASAGFGVVYEDRVFHLLGAAAFGRDGGGARDRGSRGRRGWTAGLTLARRLHSSLGPSTRRLLGSFLPAASRLAVGRAVYSEATARRLFEKAKEDLLRDPRAYWEARTAPRPRR